MKIIHIIILVSLAGTSLFAQIRGDSCVGKMNDINSDLSALARRVEKIVQASAMDEVNRGRRFIDHGDHEKAITCFEKAVALNADCYQAYGFQAILLQQDGRPNHAKAMFLMSLNAFNRKKQAFHDEHEDELNAVLNDLRVLRKRLDDLSANSLLIDGVGDSYNTKDKLFKIDMMKGNIEEALNVEGAAMFPAYFRLGFGNLYFHSKNYEAAMEQYKAGLMDMPDSPELNANLASVLFVLGKKQQALTYFQKAVELNASITPAFRKEISEYVASLKNSKM